MNFIASKMMTDERKYLGLILCVVLLFSSGYSSQKKLAQTGFQFLSVGSDARGGALGDAMTTLEMGSGSLFFNPAGMARMSGFFNAAVSQNSWIADIKHNSYSISISPYGGRYGVLGFTAISVDYGDIQGTMVWGNEQGYIETELLQPSAFALGIGYAKSLTDKFAVGGQVKYTGQQLGKSVIPVGDSIEVKKNVAFATAFDFGTIYRTGFKSLSFGMSVRNFSNEIKYEKEGFQLPLTFRIGVSMDVLDILDEGLESHSLLVSIDAVHPRSYPEQLNMGIDYKLLNTFSIRFGYMFNSDERNMTFGFGIEKFGAVIDYAYTPFGVFDNVQRFTLRFSL